MAFLYEKANTENKNIRFWLDPINEDPTKTKKLLTQKFHQLHLKPQLFTKPIIEPESGHMLEVVFVEVINDKADEIREILLEYTNGRQDYVLMES